MTSNITAARKARGITQKELARRLGVEPASVSRYEKQDSRLTLPLLREIAKALDCTVSELVGDQPLNGLAARVSIPEIDAYLAAGAGSADLGESVNRIWTFDREYIDELAAQASGLTIATVTGDSMTPTLQPGERVVIDTNDQSVQRGGIFAIEDEGELIIKRIERIPGSGQWRISSDNPHHASFEIEPGSVRIIGRALVSLHRL